MERELQISLELRNGMMNAAVNAMVLPIILGTNADGISSTELTKQLVSVRRPFPQQTNPARRPPIQNFLSNPFVTSIVIDV
jgi:hypothetical protein